MYSANHVSLWLRATAKPPPGLSQETIVIIVVSASVAGIVVFYSLYRVLMPCFSSSNAAPLPPVQPLAHHRSQRARTQADKRADLNYSSFLSPPSTFPTLPSSNGSKISLLDSELGEEQPLPCKGSQLSFSSPASSSSIQSIQPADQDQRKFSGSSTRTRSMSSLGASASRKTRRTIYGTPHSPFSRVQIILPAPLAAGSRQSISPDSRCDHPEPPPMRKARTLSYVDQWVTPVAPERDFSDILVHLPTLPRQPTE